MEKGKRLYFFTGEPSGDLHGSNLAAALKAICPTVSLAGVGGPRLREKGVRGPLFMEDFAVMGFSDVLKALPKLCRQFFRVRSDIIETAPDGVVLIDYPGFNLRLAASLRRKGYRGKIIQYISPSVWAWGRHRIEKMAQSLDMLLTIYPFEKPYFENTSLPVRYVGSPVKEGVDKFRPTPDWRAMAGIPSSAPLVGLFPGSRAGEVRRNLPLILEAAAALKEAHPDVVFGLSCTEDTVFGVLQETISDYPSLRQAIFPVAKNFTADLMRSSRCAIAKSGTVTLELALHGCPTVVLYKLTALNRLYAKYVLKLNLPHYCIVNILAGKEVFPELIQSGLTADNLYKLTEKLYGDEKARTACLEDLKSLKLLLGEGAASKQAAEAVFKVLSC